MKRFELAALIGERGWLKYHRVRINANRKFGSIRRKLKLPKRCVDCRGRAREWDHRDYFKLDKVQAVCHPCNLMRGPAWATIQALLGLSARRMLRIKYLYNLRVRDIRGKCQTWMPLIRQTKKVA